MKFASLSFLMITLTFLCFGNDKEEFLNLTFKRMDNCTTLMGKSEIYSKTFYYFYGKYIAYLEMSRYLEDGEFKIVKPFGAFDMDYLLEFNGIIDNP